MPERHTVNFKRCSFNVVSDNGRRTITLQFDADNSRAPAERILKALKRQYGGGLISRVNRWANAEGNPFVLPPGSRPHPENPDVLCFGIGVSQEEHVEAALATILGFLQQQPDYLRTIGPPLDCDRMPPRVRDEEPGDVSSAASDVLRELMNRRRRNPPSTNQPEGKPDQSGQFGDLWDREIDG